MLSLQAVEYYARWDKETINIDGTSAEPAWDGIEEADKKTASNRRTAYSVQRMRVVDKLHYLLEDIRPGDARGLFARLRRRYCTMTTGAISALTTECNNLLCKTQG